MSETHMYIESDIVLPHILAYENRETSTKKWTNDFEPINFTPHHPTRVVFDQVFGDFWPDDEDRWEVEGNEPPEQTEFLKSEADVARLFCKQISGPVRQLWYDLNPEVREFQECQPARMIGEDKDFNGKVDCSFMTETNQRAFFDFAIAEFKAPGVIDFQNWSSGSLSSGDRRLSRELRGYAYHYRCPQVCCYDGQSMLVIRFRAKETYKDIEKCDADVFVLPNRAYAGGIHLRYALYRLIADGVRRVMASLVPSVQILPWECRYEWFGGKPYWVHPTQPNLRYETIVNVTRVYDKDNRRWFWQNSGVFAAWCSPTRF